MGDVIEFESNKAYLVNLIQVYTKTTELRHGETNKRKVTVQHSRSDQRQKNQRDKVHVRKKENLLL